LTLLPQFINGVPVQWTAAKGFFVEIGGKIIRVFQKGNKLVSQNGQEARNVSVGGTTKNRIEELIARVKQLAESARKAAENYLKVSRERSGNKAALLKAKTEAEAAAKEEANAFAELRALYKQLLSNGNNKINLNVEGYLYSSEFSKMSATARTRKLAELYKKSKPGTREREIIKTRILEEIRNAGQNADPGVALRRLQNLRTNLGSYLNRDLSRAFGTEKFRARENIGGDRRSYENRGRRRSYENRELRRRSYENGSRRRSYENGGSSRSYENGGSRSYENGGSSRRRYGNEEKERSAESLSMNQKNAITNAGGITTALNTIATVPGGATEVANVAKALNASPGNTARLSPVAVQAVQKLGGSKKTIVVLQGLNTLSQKTHRKTQRRRKPIKIRVAELNRVINAVKKKKLISLMAHNVTKTHNIHPNDEKKKNYYKKVLKSNILRTKFSKIVKKAAKK
jgi:hypothetical protein